MSDSFFPAFHVRPLPRGGEPFARYEYEVCKGERIVARIVHDFHGEAVAIIFPDDWSDSESFAKVGDVLEGDPARPALTRAALYYFESKFP